MNSESGSARRGTRPGPPHVVARVVRLAGLGVVLGLNWRWASAADPLTYVAVSRLLLGVAELATHFPAASRHPYRSYPGLAVRVRVAAGDRREGEALAVDSPRAHRALAALSMGSARCRPSRL